MWEFISTGNQFSPIVGTDLLKLVMQVQDHVEFPICIDVTIGIVVMLVLCKTESYTVAQVVLEPRIASISQQSS